MTRHLRRERIVMLAYVALVALTRVLFGAHFPIDVMVGAVLGYELGLFSARLMTSARMLPARAPADPVAEPVRTPA